MSNIVVVALYKFVTLKDFEALRQPLLDTMNEHGVKGTLLLALEGINGTVAGTREGTGALLEWLRRDARLSDLDWKESVCEDMPFYRTKVKLKKEIVTIGQPDISPNERVGTYVEPQDWNALISDPQVLLIDTRNDYEVSIGTFEVRLIRRPRPSVNFPRMCASSSTRRSTRRWRCSAPAVSAARRPPVSCSRKASRRSTTSRAVF